MKFTTDYEIFEPIVAPVSVIITGVISAIYGLRAGNRGGQDH